MNARAGEGATTSGKRPADGDRAALRQADETGAKLAARVVDQVVDDIAALGWPEGRVLGAEADLLRRYGVSRAVFREAVRLLEHKQVARMRRGPGGGLVVMGPTAEPVLDAAIVYLFYAEVSIDDIFDARIVLEDLVAQLAPVRITENGIAAIRDLQGRERAGPISDPRELHSVLATITGNPALAFFVDLLSRLAHLHLDDYSVVEAEGRSGSHRAHKAIAAAVLAGDPGAATHLMRTHLAAEASYLRKKSRARLSFPSPGRHEKRAQQVARTMIERIAADGWPVGELLGTEAELMAEYQVSRAVFREAVRVLEHHHVAEMRRGRGGGLIVTEPSLDATIEAVSLYLDQRSISRAHVFEVRAAVEMAVVEKTCGNLGAAQIAALEQVLAAEQQTPASAVGARGDDIHSTLARLTGNKVLELLARVTVRLTRFRFRDGAAVLADAPTRDLMDAHRTIFDAVAAGDLPTARLRMRSHLDDIHAMQDQLARLSAQAPRARRA